MSIVLIAKDEMPIVEIGERLIMQGAGEVSLVKMNEILNEGKTVDQADMVILISATLDIVDAGDRVNQIRQRLGQEQRLVLCMLRPPNPQLLLQLGADEIIFPAGPTVERVAERILGHLILERRVEPYAYDALRGATPQMRALYSDIEQYGRMQESVLILGETGTGKGLVAEALHESRRGVGKLVHIDCATIGPNVIESELFGHLKGAFTNALTSRKGLIEESQGGTAFIDEIGDLDKPLQAKLLDAVEKNRVRPMGANDYRDVNTRFVFATHRDLEGLIQDDLFREDLYARISVLVLEVPPLRERMADIPLLVEHLVEKYNKANSTSVTVQAGAADELFRYHWPRNVRELDSVVRRAAVRAGVAGAITDVMLRESIRDPRKLRSGHAKATQQRYMIGFDPRTDSWPAVKNRAEAAYFKALTEVATGEKDALDMVDMSRAQVFDILRKHSLKLNRNSSPTDSN